MNESMVAVDLFSGCGGMTQGLRDAGFDVISAIEIDALAVETYRLNHRDVHVFESDICQVNATDIQELLPATGLDLLAACPPCQGFSSVRTLRGRRATNDPRNELLFEVLRFVESLSPRAILFENVPGLASNERFMKFLAELARKGYNASSFLEDAAEYGVPQRRRRLLVLALRDSTLSDHPRPGGRMTVRDAIGTLPAPGKARDPLHDYSEKRGREIRKLIRLIPPDGGGRKDLPLHMQRRCHIRSNGFYDVYGRMSWDDVAPTITGGCINPSKGRFLHPTQNRAITLREAALLQSFPATYCFSMRRGRYRVAEMIGNALPPRMITHQASRLRDSLLNSG